MVLVANLIELREGQEGRVSEILLEDPNENDRHRGKEEIVRRESPLFVERGCTESIKRLKGGLRQVEGHAFVERAEEELGDADVVPVAVDQQQPLQEPELRD